MEKSERSKTPRTSVSFGETGGNQNESPEEDTRSEPHPIRVQADRVLGGRYRLEEVLRRRAETQTWRGFDVMLKRSVVVHLLPPDGRNEELLAAARRAALTTDFRFLRVLDAAIPLEADQLPGPVGADGPDDSRIGPYIVCEYAPGTLLEDLLPAGPLSALEAAWLVREVADTLVGMHAQGRYHSRLSPETVVITTDGTIKIVGFFLEAELAPSRPTIHDAESVDVRDLGRLLYATLVSLWPGGNEHGLAAAPTDSAGRVLTPRQVHANVSKALDQICDRIMNPSPRDQATRLRTAAEVYVELSRVLGTADASQDLAERARRPGHPGGEKTEVHSPAASAYPRKTPADERAPEPSRDPEPTSRLSVEAPAAPVPRTPPAPTPAPTHEPARRPRPRWIPVLAAIVALAVIGGLVAVLSGLLPLRGGADGSGAAGPAEQWAIAAAQDFDPEGDTGEEHREEVPLAWDGNPETAWTTLWYNEADIGNKSGLGIIFDLGSVRQVSRVELELVGDGTSVEVRVPQTEGPAAAPRDGIDQWRLVGGADQAPAATTITLQQPVSTRFVLVYLTALPPDGGRYSGGIAEARFWS